MSFKTQAEIYQALLDGKTLTHNFYKINVRMSEDGNLNLKSWTFHVPSDWDLFIESKPKPKKTIKFFECVVKHASNEEYEIRWLNELSTGGYYQFFKTGQTRIVEIDE